MQGCSWSGCDSSRHRIQPRLCCAAFAILLPVSGAWGQSVGQQLPSVTAPTAAAPVVATESGVVTEANPTAADVTGAESAGVQKSGWLSNFFTSKREKRKQWLERGDYQSLARDTGDAAWSAAGQYREGDLPAALESFAALPGEQALYNHATALAHAGEYQQSLDQYDRLLQQNPQHADALFNREIVEKLQQQQQQQQQQGGGQGEQQQQDEQQQDQEQQEGESGQGEQKQASDSEQQQTDESGNASQQEPGEDGQPAQPDLEELQQAQESQQQQQLQEQLEQQRQQALRELAEEAPLNEQQQATEQWLRQIPDDPSGLLRRKLERSHLNEYPGVTSSKQPW